MTTKRDLLIHYDESSEELIIYSVNSNQFANIRSKEFDGARTDIEWFKEKTADEAERELGSQIFALLDTFSEKKTNIRDYKSLNEIALKEYISQLESESDQGSAEAKYHLFFQYHSIATRELDILYLDKSEKLLQESSALGFEAATTFLNDSWSIMKDSTLSRIKRNTQNK